MSKPSGKQFISIRLNMSKDEFDLFLASVPGVRPASGTAGICVAMMIAEGMLRIERVGVAELMRKATKERIACQIEKRVRVSSDLTCLLSLYEALPIGVKSETIGYLVKNAISIYMDENPREANKLIGVAIQRMGEVVLSAVPVTENSDFSLPMPCSHMGKEDQFRADVKADEQVSSNDAAQDMNEGQSLFVNHPMAGKMYAKLDAEERQALADLDDMLQFDDMTPPVNS